MVKLNTAVKNVKYVVNTFSILLCHLIMHLTNGHKKAWKRLLSVPRTKAFALPNPKEQTTSEPTPI